MRSGAATEGSERENGERTEPFAWFKSLPARFPATAGVVQTHPVTRSGDRQARRTVRVGQIPPGPHGGPSSDGESTTRHPGAASIYRAPPSADRATRRTATVASPRTRVQSSLVISRRRSSGDSSVHRSISSHVRPQPSQTPSSSRTQWPIHGLFTVRPPGCRHGTGPTRAGPVPVRPGLPSPRWDAGPRQCPRLPWPVSSGPRPVGTGRDHPR